MNDQHHPPYSRRHFLRLSTATTSAWVLGSTSLFAANASESQAKVKLYRNKALGCFMGAAIADAMGGPVEGQHYKRIAKLYPDFQGLLKYGPPGQPELRPGYALSADPGNVTDDTYIRMDLVRYLLANDPPYSVEQFASWLVANGDFTNWWQTAVKPLRLIEAGKANAQTSGLTHRQGGGGGWWQPVAILHAGDPEKASTVTSDLCRIWKAPLEQDILSSVVAGQAVAFKEGSTIDSIVDAILADSGPLAQKLFTRAVELARKANNKEQLFELLHQHCLVKECTTDVDGPMPPHVEPIEYTDGPYAGILFAEQQPFALAYFVYGQGDPRKTLLPAVKGGRDADSIATNTASWLGAMSGESVWPADWIETTQKANITRMNLQQAAEDLVQRGLKHNTVRLDVL